RGGSGSRLRAVHYVIRKIAINACYRCTMLVLIFTSALRWVARLAGAVRMRPPRFPAISLPDPVAEEMFSLPAGPANPSQRADFTGHFRLGRTISGRKTKISLLSGKASGLWGQNQAGGRYASEIPSASRSGATIGSAPCVPAPIALAPRLGDRG